MTKEMQTTDTAGVTAKLTTAPTPTANKPKTFIDILNAMKPEIEKALPRHITAERMMRIAQTAFSRNPKLQECDPLTIIGAVVQASQMGLEIDTHLGHAYLIPRKNGKTKKMEAQFQIGYKGELSLAYRTGQYKIISAYCVYKDDVFEYELGMEQKLIHKPAKDFEDAPTFYYAIYKTISGGEGFYVMSREQVVKHANQYSQAYKNGWSSPWTTDFDMMAKKTVLRKVLAYAPKSIEYEQQFSQDGTVKREIEKDMSLVPNVIDFDGEK